MQKIATDILFNHLLYLQLYIASTSCKDSQIYVPQLVKENSHGSHII